MNRRKGKSTSSGYIETAVGDALSSFCCSTVGPLYDVINKQHGVFSWLLVSTTLYSIIDVMFEDNSSNPTTMLSYYAAGKGDHSLLFLVLRSLAQAIGWMAGSGSTKDDTSHTTPPDAGGKLPPDELAVREVAGSFLNCFIPLCIEAIESSPSRKFLIYWVYTLMYMLLYEVTDADRKGINLNPASQLGEDLANGRPISWEHLFLYWFCPLTGAIIAGWAFGVIVNTARILRAIFSVILRFRI